MQYGSNVDVRFKIQCAVCEELPLGGLICFFFIISQWNAFFYFSSYNNIRVPKAADIEYILIAAGFSNLFNINLSFTGTYIKNKKAWR